MNWSRDLLKKGVARNVIYRRAAVQTPYVEGELMALYARAIGVPDGVIHTETNALHSCEEPLLFLPIGASLGI